MQPSMFLLGARVSTRLAIGGATRADNPKAAPPAFSGALEQDIGRAIIQQHPVRASLMLYARFQLPAVIPPCALREVLFHPR